MIGRSGDSESRAADELLHSAKGGGEAMLGQLLESYRNYLKLLATMQLNARLNARVSPSDIVQETFLRAHESFPQFRGECSAEFLQWLRKILASRVANTVDAHLGAEKRDARREISLLDVDVSLEQSAVRLADVIPADISTPSGIVSREEHAVILADVLAELPDDYRDVLIMRDLEGLAFQDVAERMERSSGAVRMLWCRAIESLRRKLVERGMV